jgi:hypothetical protein
MAGPGGARGAIDGPAADVDTSVIALWLGHEQADTTPEHADLELKEKALARTAPANTKSGRYQPRTSSSPSSKASDYAGLQPAIRHSRHNVGITRRSA